MSGPGLFRPVWARAAEVCACGHRRDEHADLAADRARFPTRCQTETSWFCSCYEFRAETAGPVR